VKASAATRQARRVSVRAQAAQSERRNAYGRARAPSGAASPASSRCCTYGSGAAGEGHSSCAARHAHRPEAVSCVFAPWSCRDTPGPHPLEVARIAQRAVWRERHAPAAERLARALGARGRAPGAGSGADVHQHGAPALQNLCAASPCQATLCAHSDNGAAAAHRRGATPPRRAAACAPSSVWGLPRSPCSRSAARSWAWRAATQAASRRCAPGMPSYGARARSRGRRHRRARLDGG
jgi:hypothetical protein